MKFLMKEDGSRLLLTFSLSTVTAKKFSKNFSLQLNPNHCISSSALRSVCAMLKHKGGLHAERAEKTVL